jgi:PleD family two-component response regulator
METSPAAAEAPPSILLVAADPLHRDLISMALVRKGYRVEKASRPEEARLAVSNHRPALIVLDLFLEQVNGLELLRTMRSSWGCAHTPVVVISGFGFQEVVQQAVQAGAAAFFVKPVDTEQLVQRVERLIRD